MRKILILPMIAFVLFSCGGGSVKFALGVDVIVKNRCMATSSEFAYDDMQKASNDKNENALQDMMIKGDLLILNKGQEGVIAWSDNEKSQIKIFGGSKWWVSNNFLKTKE